jgi:hypothetical protein
MLSDNAYIPDRSNKTYFKFYGSINLRILQDVAAIARSDLDPKNAICTSFINGFAT